VAGLEKALEGKPEGASLAVLVAAADGYGTRDESLIQRVLRRSLLGAGTIKKGTQFQERTDGGAGEHHH
jgi:FKBP-type peptidyl-prolyl cis-trans isomerase SlyD